MDSLGPPATRTVRHDLLLRATDAELCAFAQAGLGLLVGDAAGSLVRHAESHRRDDGDDLSTYRLGNEHVGLDVREEERTIDAGGINNRPNGGLLAFAAYGLPAGMKLEVRREVDGSDLQRVIATLTGPERAAEAFDEAFYRELARMSRAEVGALAALRRVPSLPETNGFELPDFALGWELAKIDPKRVEIVAAARDALALVATDAARKLWLGAVHVKLGDLEAGAEAMVSAHAAAPESGPIALTAARVLLDLGRNRDAVALLSPFARASPPVNGAELLALALFRGGRPAEALAALDGRRGVSRARLIDATGDRAGAVRELRRAFLESPNQALLFQAGAAGPRSLLVSAAVGSKLDAMIDEAWILEMWGDPRVSRMLQADFTRDLRGYLALLAVEDVPPFWFDMSAVEAVAPEAVHMAANTAADPAKLERALQLLGTLWQEIDSFPGIKVRMALLSMMLGRREDALRLFEQVLTRWPTDAAAIRGRAFFALWPQIHANGVTYASVPLRGTETFVITARDDARLIWEQRINIQIMEDRARLELADDALRLILELDGEHPKDGAAIRERVFFEASSGRVLGREGLAR